MRRTQAVRNRRCDPFQDGEGIRLHSFARWLGAETAYSPRGTETRSQINRRKTGGCKTVNTSSWTESKTTNATPVAGLTSPVMGSMPRQWTLVVRIVSYLPRSSVLPGHGALGIP